MIKIVGYWAAPRPDQLEAFEQHYADTHIRLAAKLPHLRGLTAGRMERGLAGGEPAHYRVVELLYDSEEDMKESMASEEWAAMAKDAEHIIETFGAVNSGDFCGNAEVFI